MLNENKINLKHVDESLFETPKNAVEYVDFLSENELQEFYKDVKRCISEVAAKYGITLQSIQSSKSYSDVTMSLICGPVQNLNMDSFAQNYLTFGPTLNLKPEWFNVPVVATIAGKSYHMRITGLLEDRGGFKVRLITDKGERYLAPDKVVVMYANGNRKSPVSNLAMQMFKANIQKNELRDKLFGRGNTQSLLGQENATAPKSLESNEKSDSKVVPLNK
ncbi:hypothetical protein HB762_26935 (plasmid) [Vibrio campbellii]|uniref:Uncharacterized protein n=1 Tax=Vibrio campbellii TaxID=680 RepID=A0ABY5IKS1_9VIBR|nr:hypothetical protein [Vibrio campbellii]UTZ34900.1 hypothetical protein HB762_26935 [Vibrio campbellii]